MADQDNSGYEAAIAEIPKGQLSEREQRIAAGIAMVKVDGFSILQASKKTGIPYTTLSRHVRGITTTVSNNVEAAREDLLETAYAVASGAAAHIQARLDDENHEWKDGDLAKVYGIATDKFDRLQNAGGMPTSGVAALIDVLTKEHDLTLSKRDPATDAIDVTETVQEQGE